MQCLVVDDDRKFSYKLSGYIDSFLKGIFKNYQVLEINEKFDDFSQYQNIDLLFIDIDLKDLNGINIIKRLQMNNVDYPIIYVSSRQELVFSSLATQPFYFVRKQNLENDLKELFKLLNIYYKKTMKMITFDYYGRKTSIFLKDIHYITSFGHDISIVCDQETYTYRSSLKDALKLIDSPIIVQVHRSYSVSMMYIKEVDKNNIILKDETCITLGKKYVDEFMFQYREYLIS